MDCPKGHRPPLTSETLQSKGDAGGRGPQEAPNEPQGASTFRPEFYSQKWGWGQVGWVAGAQVMLRVGSGGLKYHLDSGGRRLRTPTGERMQPLGLARCSHTSWRGQCRGGHTRSGSWENATAARPAARPPTKPWPVEESEQPIVVPGPPSGARGLHPGDLAPPPPTPNTCSRRHLQGCPHPGHPGEEDEDAPFGRNLTLFPRRDQLIKPLPLHLTRAV